MLGSPETVESASMYDIPECASVGRIVLLAAWACSVGSEQILVRIFTCEPARAARAIKLYHP